MSTRARKDRKAAGIPFTKAPKVGTPILERTVNQPRLVRGLGLAERFARFGLSKSTERRLRDLGAELTKESNA